LSEQAEMAMQAENANILWTSASLIDDHFLADWSCPAGHRRARSRAPL
jgi:hypothetical protein